MASSDIKLRLSEIKTIRDWMYYYNCDEKIALRKIYNDFNSKYPGLVGIKHFIGTVVFLYPKSVKGFTVINGKVCCAIEVVR